MEKEITLSFTDINDTNKDYKFNKAVSVLAYQLGIHKSINKDTEHGEGFYFKSHKELTEKHFEYIDQFNKDYYKMLCSFLGLPESNVISKANVIYKGKILYSPETGKPLKKSDLDKLAKRITVFLNRTKGYSHDVVTQSQVLGRILEKLSKNQNIKAVKDLSLSDIKYKNKTFDFCAANAGNIFVVDDVTKMNIDNIQNSAGQKIAGISNRYRDEIQQIILDGVKDHKSKSKISQELFDKLGHLNKDWKRIVDTELSNNMNNGYINQAIQDTPQGEKCYFQRMEVIDSKTCNFCKKMNGTIALYSNVPLVNDKITDKYATHAIWEGKNWDGNNNYLAMGVFHPRCRGVWVNWTPIKL